MPLEGIPAEIALWVAETLAARLAGSIESMTGERPAVEVRAAGPDAPAEGALWWQQPLSPGPQAALWIGGTEETWLAIGRHTLRSAGIDTAESAEARNTFLEIASQAFSGLCQALSDRLKTQLSCVNGAEAAGPAPDSTPFEIDVVLTGFEPLKLLLNVSPNLVVSVAEAESGGLECQKAGPPVPVERSATSDSDSRVASTKTGKTLDLLLEVELPVSVSFGRADLALKDVLKLTTGSIVELNRAVSEPVEVIVNNCVIARGEVVVIEGNYGVRIHEIISRDKRLRTLR
jgi:flagellar motor switch protein FliN/FliY